MFRTVCLFALLAVAHGLLPKYNLTQSFGDPNAVGVKKHYDLEMLEYKCTADVEVNKNLCDWPKFVKVFVDDWQPIKYIVLNGPELRDSTIGITRGEPCALKAAVSMDAIC